MKVSYIPFLVLVSACIGNDTVNDELVDPELEVSPKQVSIPVGGEATLSAAYHNEFGVEESVVFTWSAANESIAVVNPQGSVSGVGPGQTYIFVEFENLKDSCLMTVAGNADEVASVEISAERTELGIGENVQLSASVKNLAGEDIPGKTPVYESSDQAVVTVSSTGEVEAIGNGTATITAEVDDISSLPLLFIVGATSLTGIFQGNSGYATSGTATLTRNSQNELILTFSNDFATTFALGTFVYMANTTLGAQVANSGLELGEITTNGAKEFNITEKDNSAALSTYKYVIILCKPASITFGIAELN